MGTFRRNSFGWVTLTLFLGSLTSHFALAMANGNSVAEWAQSFFENIQSEAAQLLLQVVGLKFLLQVGAPSSKEAGERLEDKIDALLQHELPDGAQVIRTLDAKHMRH
jgi:hypothetical protein